MAELSSLPDENMVWSVSTFADRSTLAGTAKDNNSRKDIMNAIEQEQLVSVRALASRLGLSTRGVYRLVARGQFPPPVKVGGASRWCESDLEEYLSRLKAARGTR